MKTEVYFVRRAQPDFTVRDDAMRPLSEKGMADARRVTNTLMENNITAIYSSPLRRAVDTISGLAENAGIEITIGNDFRERKIGEWVEDFRSFSQKQWEEFDFKLAEGESLREVQERNISALFEVIRRNPGRSVVIATHGTALSTIMNYFDPSFAYDEFLDIVDRMPHILRFRFDGMNFECVDEIELSSCR